MSCLASKSQFKYASRDAERCIRAAGDVGDGEDFGFQYVPVNKFKNIIKDVRRQRNRNEDEAVWTTFLREQEQLASSIQSNRKYTTRTLAESLEEVDRELMRLEADSLPEMRSRTRMIDAKDYQEELTSAKSLRKDSPVTKENGTGSTNCLIPIPEEENDCYSTELSDSLKSYSTFIKKSYSDQTIKNSRINSRSYHYNTNEMEFHSSPNISPDQSSNENDLIPVRPDPIVVAKILGIQRKISIVLNNISYELDRIPLPDGENDLLRRQQRVVEFSTRLSRNYLYDLSRQISDIQRHLKVSAPNSKVKLSRRAIIIHMQAVEQKLISAHQLLLTALSAYWKHIPSSVLKSHPGKLRDILKVVVQLKNICSEIQLTPDIYCCEDDRRGTYFGKETENKCSIILSKFRCYSDNESQAPSHSTKSTVATLSRGNKKRNRKTISNRFNMCAMDMKLVKAYLPKKTQSMFQLSKDKKHNCSVSKPLQSSTLAGSKKLNNPIVTKISDEAIGIKTIKISLPPKEDDIQTMMETVQPDLDGESLQSLKFNRNSEIFKESSCKNVTYKITKESEKLQKDISYKSNDEENKSYSCLVPVIEDLLLLVKNNKNNTSSIDILHDCLKKCRAKVNSCESQISHNVNDIEIGSKNMRLICCSRNEENYENLKAVNVENHENILKFNEVSCQANYLNKNGTFELFISDVARSSITDYHNQYQSLLELNPMYTSTTQNKPWDIVAWIADKLVDEIIIELVGDFQMEEVLQKLFELEFQEF